MIVRPAEPADLPRILEMARLFYPSTPYPAFAPICDDSIAALVTQMCDTGVMLVADDGAGPVGMVGLVIAPFIFNRAYLAAYEVVWWVDPKAQGKGAGAALLAAIEPACRARGCAAIQMVHLATSPPQAARLYERMGYVHSETSYTKVL